MLTCSHLLQAAEDIRSDPMLWEACKEDAKNFCKDVKFGGGRVQACLVRRWRGAPRRPHRLRHRSAGAGGGRVL